ncbi:MAG: hypothetical protein EBZ91_13985 [Gammaproteobacteria bacterium]|jgi:hypothetical protein|nr:hypothetical protein [Gammaproteobacteria bacterium]
MNSFPMNLVPAVALFRQKETYSEPEPVWLKALSTITSTLFAIVAVYLSWQCNTKFDHPVILKIAFAVLAFLFGPLYIAYYYLFRFDACR